MTNDKIRGFVGQGYVANHDGSDPQLVKTERVPQPLHECGRRWQQPLTNTQASPPRLPVREATLRSEDTQ